MSVTGNEVAAAALRPATEGSVQLRYEIGGMTGVCEHKKVTV